MLKNKEKVCGLKRAQTSSNVKNLESRVRMEHAEEF
jgi:hypothetical protein